MKALILAAGFGTRLRPLTERVPKPLVPVAGRPMIAYPLALVRAAGIEEVVINLHHLGEQIRAALGDGSEYGVRIVYSEEDPILDTGGAVQKAAPMLGGDTFVVVNADTVIDLDLREVVAWHRQRGAAATLVLRRDPEAARYGIIETDDRGRIRRFLGRPRDAAVPLAPYMFCGVHVLEPTVFRYMRPGRFSITRETYPAMVEAGEPLFGYVFEGYWRVLDTPEGLEQGRRELAGGQVLAPSRRP